MNGVQNETLSSGNTAETVLVLTDVDQNERKAFFPKVLSGTVKFGVGDIVTNAKGWTSADTIPPMSCKNGELYFQQAANGDTFVVSATPA